MSHLVGQHPAVPAMECRYGAPLGRVNKYVACSKFYVHRIRMISYSAYDEGGAYWGKGSLPLYVAWNREGLRVYTRGKSSAAVRRQVIGELKRSKLWRTHAQPCNTTSH